MAKYVNRDELLDMIGSTMRDLAADLPEEAEEILEVVESTIRERIYDMDEEPRSGEWIYSADGSVHCSECGEDVEPSDISKYCPHCGAFMDEEEDDEDE